MLIKELYGFLRTRKKFWLTPLIVLLLLMGLIIFFSQAATLSFVYTVF